MVEMLFVCYQSDEGSYMFHTCLFVMTSPKPGTVELLCWKNMITM